MADVLFDKLYNIEDITKTIPDKVLSFINENFKILEMSLNKAKTASITIDELSDGIFDGIIMEGLEADLPSVLKRNGKVFYWTTDTHRLFRLVLSGGD